jgi:hypothetical protein
MKLLFHSKFLLQKEASMHFYDVKTLIQKVPVKYDLPYEKGSNAVTVVVQRKDYYLVAFYEDDILSFV